MGQVMVKSPTNIDDQRCVAGLSGCSRNCDLVAAAGYSHMQARVRVLCTPHSGHEWPMSVFGPIMPREHEPSVGQLEALQSKPLKNWIRSQIQARGMLSSHVYASIDSWKLVLLAHVDDLHCQTRLMVSSRRVLNKRQENKTASFAKRILHDCHEIIIFLTS